MNHFSTSSISYVIYASGLNFFQISNKNIQYLTKSIGQLLYIMTGSLTDHKGLNQMRNESNIYYVKGKLKLMKKNIVINTSEDSISAQIIPLCVLK